MRFISPKYGIRAQFAGVTAALLFAVCAERAAAQPIDCSEPGWNWVDVGIALTANQPTYWSVATGLPGGVSPFTILDPGPPPGRPALDGTNERVLRGFVIAWAVNVFGEEIRWNHLKGDAVIVNYARGTAWEYTTYAFQAVNPALANGAATGTPGQLFLNGVEYDNGFDLLLLDFYATGSQPFGLNSVFTLESELTLMPIEIDVRQETTGPVTTKASFTIWNQNEIKLTGLDRCVTCWDDTLLGRYGVPNHFLVENLQTDKGKAHIDGLASQLCTVDYNPGDGLPLGADPRDVISQAASLLGVVSKQIAFGPNGPHMTAGMNLVGMGTQTGRIRADLADFPPPERPEGEVGGDLNVVRVPIKKALPGMGDPQPIPLAPNDRATASDKGSLLIFPKVELRWDATGTQLIQDTFVDLTNDYPEDVLVQMYFVQGDPPFVSNGIDANTNGVPDDCEDRLRWSCNVPINGVGACQVNPSGPYASLAECTADCGQRYRCVFSELGGDVAECVADAQGPFATLAECEAECGVPRYTCAFDGKVDYCTEDQFGEFASLGDCLAECGEPRYSCAFDTNGGFCVEDPFGPYNEFDCIELNICNNGSTLKSKR